MRAPSTTIIIPFRDAPYRARNLKFVLAYWKHRIPDAHVVVADSGCKKFNKSKTINEAFRAAPRSDCTIMADGDCFTTDNAINQAMYKFWGRLILPHRGIASLTERQSTDVLKVVDPAKRIGGKIYRKNRRKKPMCGGIWVMDSEILDANPLNEEFAGWGGEDVEYLGRVPHERLNAPLYHLYHPVQSREDREHNERLIERSQKEYYESQRDLLNRQGSGSSEPTS